MKVIEVINECLPIGAKLVHHAIDFEKRLVHFEYEYKGKKWRSSIKLYRNRYVEKI